jgi:plastocyanin
VARFRKVRTALAAVAAVLALLSCGGRQSAAADPPPTTHTILVEAVRFVPEVLTIKAGDTIVWINKDPFPHTAVSTAVGLDSKEIAAGASWKFSPTTKGEIPYVCTLHPTMKGVLRVE